jgi:hypothetical protein
MARTLLAATGVMLQKQARRRQTGATAIPQKAKGRPKWGGLPHAEWSARRLRHPEGLMGFAVRVATRDPDVAQCRVAQTFQFLAGTRTALPLANAVHEFLPTEQALRLEAGDCADGHGCLHMRQI